MRRPLLLRGFTPVHKLASMLDIRLSAAMRQAGWIRGATKITFESRGQTALVPPGRYSVYKSKNACLVPADIALQMAAARKREAYVVDIEPPMPPRPLLGATAVVSVLAHVDHVNCTTPLPLELVVYGHASKLTVVRVPAAADQCDTYNTGRPGFNYMGVEVLATRLVGTYPCGAADSTPASFRSGWRASAPCSCDPKAQFLNCRGVPAVSTLGRWRGRVGESARGNLTSSSPAP